MTQHASGQDDLKPLLLRATLGAMSLLSDLSRLATLAAASGASVLTPPLRASSRALEGVITELGAAARLLDEARRGGGPGG